MSAPRKPVHIVRDPWPGRPIYYAVCVRPCTARGWCWPSNERSQLGCVVAGGFTEPGVRRQVEARGFAVVEDEG